MIHTSMDLAREGKQQGFLQVPYSHNLGGWANVMVPMTVIARGEGTLLNLRGLSHRFGRYELHDDSDRDDP
jgi:N-alpha-acetyl-L-2,4-diaminobutyrate deacetylase